jgi:hypothetical protein
MLNITLITNEPNTTNRIVKIVISPILKKRSIPPITKLKKAQRIFKNGEDNPFPRGLANGVGNLLPDIPCIKCGTAFAKKIPEIKQTK